MKKHVIDVFKDGEGNEKSVSIMVDGIEIGSIHLGTKERVGDPFRVIVSFGGVGFGPEYGVAEVDCDYKRGGIHFSLLKNPIFEKKGG